MADNEKQPIIFSIDDDPQVLRALRRDLREAYKEQYRIISSGDPKEALESLPELKKRGETVALFISDQRMPGMGGVDFLEAARKVFPSARRVLLTAYSDTDAAIRAINDVQLDYYFMKPWDPPQEKLYPVLNDLLDDWQATYRPAFHGIRVAGYQFSPRSHEIKDFLGGNLRPYQWLDIETNPEAQELIDLHGLTRKDLPVVFFDDQSYLVDPDVREIAGRVGLNPTAGSDLYDVVIVGAGPAGLAAAVYGASEGLKTLLVERRAPGGQAGTSSRIENYLGFPNGLTGAELTHRALTQAKRFGTEFLTPQEVHGISVNGKYKSILLSDGSSVNTRAVIITTGVDYRRLPAAGVENLTGAGIYYGAAITEAHSCSNKHVFVIGGGNSAGQGAVHLSKFAEMVTILIRQPDLSSTMSSYLIEQIEKIPNIQVCGCREVVEVKGESHLEKIIIKNLDDGSSREADADALFVFIGARPFTDWLGDAILRNDKGYIETGSALTRYPDFRRIWKLQRSPYLLETCQPGIFAAGDVRAGAMNRVASAVGEGAMAIKFVHQYLAEA